MIMDPNLKNASDKRKNSRTTLRGMGHGIEIDGVTVFAVDTAALHQDHAQAGIAVHNEADNGGEAPDT
jgi:hypothetical protein